MKIAIRDDDLCFYSDYSSFRSIYRQLGVPVSASVTPFAVPNHGDSFPFGDYPRDTQRSIEENPRLVKSLNEDVACGLVEILLHGYSHEYKFVDDHWVPEMLWKEPDRIMQEMQSGKALLERTFNQPITVFVAPSNAINDKGIAACEALGLGFSGSPNRLADRKLSIRHIINVGKRHLERLLYGRPCSVCHYKKHIEIPICGLADLSVLSKYFRQCKNHNWDMVLVVHYWRLLKYPNELRQLTDFISFVKNKGGKFCFLSDCFKMN